MYHSEWTFSVSFRFAVELLGEAMNIKARVVLQRWISSIVTQNRFKYNLTATCKAKQNVKKAPGH